tara:strand:- start:257 stop:634 length:378 start_codon:yes stop_codon:yes gene_type:complete
MSTETTDVAIDGDNWKVNINGFEFTTGKLSDALAEADELPFTGEEATAYLDVHASEEAQEVADRIRKERRDLEEKEQRNAAEQQRLEELTQLDNLHAARENDIETMRNLIADTQKSDRDQIFSLG